MKKILLGVLVCFIIIQFIRPEKNISENITNEFSVALKAPEAINLILETSCIDCHSNNTKYPWYSEIAPVSWFLAEHVNNGKTHLNFSEWSSYNSNQKKHIIKDFKEVLQTQEMPLKSYLIMHKDAALTKEQSELFKNWIKTIVIN